MDKYINKNYFKGGKMQDRFKFRFWNKELKRFTKGGAVKFGGICFIMDDGENDVIQLAEDQDNYVIQQCTGLYDKNGKLIYEGDIVKDKFGSLYKVEYENVITGFYPFNNYDIAINGYFDEDIEVIGNIYHDSHLLENRNNLC